MHTHPDLLLQMALDLHQERIAQAEHWRQVAFARAVHHRPAPTPTGQRSTPNSVTDPRFGDRLPLDVKTWLTRAGDIVTQYSTAELDGHRRHAFGALVDGLLVAAREGGVDVRIRVEADDPAVVLLRTLGRLATYAAGDGSISLSRPRAKALQAALDELVDSSAVEKAPTRADAAA